MKNWAFSSSKGIQKKFARLILSFLFVLEPGIIAKHVMKMLKMKIRSKSASVKTVSIHNILTIFKFNFVK